MAGNTVSVDLKVEDKSGTIKRRTDEARTLNTELERSKRLAAGGGADSGTRALAAQNIEYGRARGAMGATGASARDFANQAQGLGGLVQLYATYAANLFAVSAAFRALSEAMNTANMVEGLNQLGAASGNALGALAKQFQLATGNALSLRESVEAVSKASSAGLSNEQILKVSASATKASQVLGLALPDAVNRLTRGIVKLEPELLDELGIFTKIGPAVEEYARKLGRTESSLSDFERRQAFAIAVLKEAETKFGEIKIPTNPYDKLLATLKDISVTGLQVINTVLGPIVKLLSESPVALAAVIGLLAKNLLGRVIPIIGQYNKALETSANTAVERYSKISDIAKANEKARIAAISNRAVFEKEKLEDIKNKELDALEAVSRKRLDRRTKEILDRQKTEGIQAVTARDIAYLESKKPAIYADVAKRLEYLQTLNKDILKIEKESVELQQKKPGLFTAAGAAAARAETARRSAEGRLTVQEVSRTAQEVGLGAATKKAITDISDKRLGVVAGTLTAVGSAGVIAAEGVSRLAAVFSRFLGWIGLIVSAYQIFDAIFSKNGKEIEAYNTSLDALTESTKTATETSKKFGEQLTVQSIIAKSNALNTLSEDIGKVSGNLLAADQIASWWDRRIDDLLVIFGKDLRSKFVEQISPALIESLKLISDPELKAQAEAGFRELLNIKPGAKFDLKAVAEQLRDLDAEGFRKVAPQITQQLNKINESSKAISAPLKSLKDDFSNLEKSYLELNNTFIAQDPITRFALNLNKVANTLNTALAQSINQIAILNDIANDPSLIRGFPAQIQREITTTIKQIADLEQSIKRSRISIAAGREQELVYQGIQPGKAFEGVQLQITGQQQIDIAQAKIKELRENLSKSIIQAGNQAVKIIADGIQNTFRQIAIDLQKGVLGYLPKTPETIKISADLERESISVRREELTRIRELVISNDKLRLTQELSRLELERNRASSFMDTDAVGRLTDAIKDIEQQRQAYERPMQLQASARAGQQLLGTGANNILANTAEFQKQLAKLAGEQVLVNFRQTIDTAGAEVARKIEAAERGLQQQKTANLTALEELRAQGETPENIAARKLVADTAEREAEARIKLLSYDKSIAEINSAIVFSQQQINQTTGETQQRWYSISKAAQQQLDLLRNQKTTQAASLDITNKLATGEAERANTVAQLTRSARSIDELAQENFDRVQQTYTLDIGRVRQSLEELQTRQQVLMLSDQEVANERNLLERKLLKLETEKQVLDLIEGQRKALKAIDDQIIALQEGDTARRQELERQRDAAQASYKAQIDGEIELYNRKVKNRDLTERLNERQKNYDQIFTNAFNGMADAIVRWAETGKLAGKELFASLTRDLLAYELRLQMIQLYGVVRTPLLGALGSLLPMAKGAAYDSGIKTFSRGGMFTNSIVNEPTLFKFARGTGLMGEAGPEAIMPLKRDSQGNLGVSGSGGANVEVVINNNTGQPATTRESTDSRGNRRVEVIVGDMVAGELARTGSGPQTTMRNMFNVQPRLTRR